MEEGASVLRILYDRRLDRVERVLEHITQKLKESHILYRVLRWGRSSRFRSFDRRSDDAVPGVGYGKKQQEPGCVLQLPEEESLPAYLCTFQF